MTPAYYNFSGPLLKVDGLATALVTAECKKTIPPAFAFDGTFVPTLGKIVSGDTLKPGLAGWREQLQRKDAEIVLPAALTAFVARFGGADPVTRFSFDIEAVQKSSILRPRLPPRPYLLFPVWADTSVPLAATALTNFGWTWNLLPQDVATLARATMGIGTKHVAISRWTSGTTAEGNSLAAVEVAGHENTDAQVRWVPATQSWSNAAASAFGPREPDYAEAIWPTGSLNLAKADTNFVSLHLTPSFFRPGGDEWLVNTGAANCLSLPSSLSKLIAPNKNNDVLTDWCPPPPSYLGAVPDWDSFVGECALGNLDLGDRYKHWPLEHAKTTFSGLYGHVNSSLRRDGRFTDVASDLLGTPSAHVASGDAVHVGLGAPPADTGSGRLHEGSDINWDYESTAFATPESQLQFAPTPPDGYFCYGTLTYFDSVQVAISCSDSVLEACGDDALNMQGCDFTSRMGEKYTKLMDGACGHCDGFFSCVGSIIACPVATVITAVGFNLEEAWAHAELLATAITGVPYGSAELTIFKRAAVPPKMDHEIEYNMAFGNHDIGLDVHRDCGGSYSVGTECTRDKFCMGNFQWDPNVVGEKSCKDTNSFIQNGHEWWELNTPVIGIHGWDGKAAGTANTPFDPAKPTDVDGGEFWNQVWPVAMAPGIFYNSHAVYGKYSKQAGRTRSLLVDRLLPFSESAIKEYVSSVKGKTGAYDHGYRIDFQGDLIIDCGHMPLHTEVHPPRAIVLHLGRGLDDAHPLPDPAWIAGRFSVFGLQRENDSSTISYDFWPTQKRWGARSSLSFRQTKWKDLTPDGSATWKCVQYPPSAPNRIRCSLEQKGSARDLDACKDARGFRPDCATDIDGMILDLEWKEATP